jgi:glycosyltransferase involved in cell wall biosynthesis
MKLSVSMIVKNEEACIADCLKSVRDADEIVVLDTGSTDGTAEAVKREFSVFREQFSAECRNWSGK